MPHTKRDLPRREGRSHYHARGVDWVVKLLANPHCEFTDTTILEEVASRGIQLFKLLAILASYFRIEDLHSKSLAIDLAVAAEKYQKKYGPQKLEKLTSYLYRIRYSQKTASAAEDAEDSDWRITQWGTDSCIKRGLRLTVFPCCLGYKYCRVAAGKHRAIPYFSDQVYATIDEAKIAAEAIFGSLVKDRSPND